MPRRTANRTIDAERPLARRIAYEREQRGWSYQKLAQQMAYVGCKIDQSSLFKLEKADPPRRITVDELVGFQHVFGFRSVDELLLSPEVDVIAWSLLDEWDRNMRDVKDLVEAADHAWEALVEHLRENPSTLKNVLKSPSDYGLDADEAKSLARQVKKEARSDG